MDQMNQYGYTNQYRGNQPQHSEIRGGNSFGSTGFNPRNQYQSLNPANQYGYTSQYRGNQPDHSEERGGFWSQNQANFAGNFGGASQYQAQNQANQYGYTSQYRGNLPEHSEEPRSFYGQSNFAAGNLGGNFGGGSQYNRSQFTTDPANQYGYTSQYRGNQPDHSEERGGSWNQFPGSFSGSQYQAQNQANQYGYTSQYRGNLPEHSEEPRNFYGQPNFAAGNIGGNFGGASQYNRNQFMTNPANQYGYTSQYRGNLPEHSEERGGFYPQSNFGGSQYPNMNQANQYGYTSQYRGNQPDHSEERGGFGGNF